MQRPSRRAVSGALVALVGAFVLSCHDSPTGPTRREPSSAVAVQGATQTGTAGAAATDSLVVRVTDDRGNPVAGVVVSFAVASGGGSLSAARSLIMSASSVWTFTVRDFFFSAIAVAIMLFLSRGPAPGYRVRHLLIYQPFRNVAGFI